MENKKMDYLPVDEVVMVPVQELTEHPRNKEFFDDITGYKWEEFLLSIKYNGVKVPILITEDKIVVSGNQRVRACRELGIETIPATIRDYNGNSSEIEKDLIEINIKQRGEVGGTSRQILARCKTLMDYYDVHQGRRSAKSANCTLSLGNVVELAGTSVDEYKRSKQMEPLIPELHDMVDEGKIPKVAARTALAKLTEEEQYEILSELSTENKYSQADIQQYVNRIKNLETESAEKESEYSEVCNQLKASTELVESLRNQLKRSENDHDYMELKDRFDRAVQENRTNYEKYQAIRKQYEQRTREADEIASRHERLKTEATEKLERYKDRAEHAEQERDALKESVEEMKQEIEDISRSLFNRNKELNETEAKLKEELSKDPIIVEQEVKVEVIPDDYYTMKKQMEDILKYGDTEFERQCFAFLTTTEEMLGRFYENIKKFKIDKASAFAQASLEKLGNIDGYATLMYNELSEAEPF